MRPYIAVIKDSFREALSSRVLWILLLLTSVVLLGVAPFALRERYPTRLRAGSVFDWASLITKLRAQSEMPDPSPGKHLWGLFDADVRQKIQELSEKPSTDQISSELTSALLAELNRLIEAPALYDAAAWEGIEIDAESRSLIERGVQRLEREELSRLNRVLLEQAFPDEIARSITPEIHLTYLGWNLGQPLSTPRHRVVPFLKNILAAVMNLFVGTLAVFVGILVTAPVIPQTFEAGAIDLLLSKPLSRPMLFLAKYFGGCAFILLNATYFVGGMWLIAGLRFDIWSGKLLLCIPLFLFLFAIYYSVSSLAGVLWKNPIVSVVITIIFWAACFLVGNTKQAIELFVLKPQRLARLVAAGDTLFGLNDQGQVLIWQDADRQWEPVLLDDDSDAVSPIGMSRPVLGPVYDSRSDQLLMIRMPWPGGFGLAAPDPTMLVGSRVDEWSGVTGATPPRDPIALLATTTGPFIVVTKQQAYRLEGDPRARARELRMLGLRVPLGGSRSPFVSAGPEPPLRLGQPAAAALHAVSGSLAIWNRGTLIVLERDEAGKYQRVLERPVGAESQAAVLAYGAETILLARGDGQIQIVDARDGALRHEFRPEGKNQPRFAEASPDGRWIVVVFHHHEIWLWDAVEQREVVGRIIGDSDISAAAFSAPDRLLLADRGTRVTEYELDSFRIVRQRVPEMSILERVYRYAILPMYTVFPKPGELDNVVAYLLTEQETAAVGSDADDLSAAQLKLDIRGPFWSSLAFAVCVLVVTCLYVRRADF